MRAGRLSLGMAAVACVWMGCAAGPAPRDHYYRIEATAPQKLATPPLSGVVEVDRLRVEAIAQGRRVLYRQTTEPTEISQHQYHHWSDPPSVMLQDEMAEYLRAAGIADTVVTPAVHVDSDYLVSGRIVRLERVVGDGGYQVAVELELVLTREKDRKLLFLKNYREQRVAGGGTVADATRAMNEAATAIFSQFVADLSAL